MSKNAYDAIAAFYDAFQTAEEPEAWVEFLAERIRLMVKESSGFEGQGQGGRPLLLDLGCGTGAVAQGLQDLGFDLIGIDHSENMLQEAWARAFDRESGAEDGEREDGLGEHGGNVPLYLCQDITAFELYGSVNFIYTSLDTFNHLDGEELKRCLRLCRNYLHPGGLLLFDLLTEDYMREEMGNRLYYEIDSGHALIWENAYAEDEKINRSSLTLFTEEHSGLYSREDLEITEYFHDARRVGDFLRAEGFELSLLRPSPELERRMRAEGRVFVEAAKPPLA